jgi:hypothetical protein
MSSVTRFLKQHDPAQTYLSIPNNGVSVAASLVLLYEFVATGTVTGNYPAGYVQLVSADTTVAAEIVKQAVAGNGNLILRDMGKTITAPVGNAAGVVGRYRQVQLLGARDLNATNQTFGVLGQAAGGAATSANVSYYVLYIPVPVGGVLGAAPLPGVAALAGGEM